MPFLGAFSKNNSYKKFPGTQAEPGTSAAQLKSDWGYTSDGVYYILINNVSTPVYCIMNSAMAGGGWMMAMKGAAGPTFNYNANYWTTANNLNSSDLTRSAADAKYDTFNYFPATDLLAIFPDMPSTGGSLNVSGYNWTWYQPSFGSAASLPTGSSPTTLLNVFNAPQPTDPVKSGYAGSGYFIQDAKTFSGWSPGIFSSQVDIRFYGFNFNNYFPNAYTIQSKSRWGFGWNENGDGLFPGVNTAANGSNDVAGGIGLYYNNGTVYNYSAGDIISCCNDNIGVNRPARFEMYVR
jgi:hypothetical protein